MEPGDRLKLARIKGKLDNDALAKRSGFGVSTVRAHQNGQNSIRPEVAEVYGRVLRVSPAWLLYGEGEGPGEHHAELLEAPTTDAIERLPDLSINYVGVEVLPTYAGAGGGGTGDGDAALAMLPRSLVEDELRAKPSDLLVINVRGDSMEPVFHHGDQLVIDRRDRNPIQPGPFALLYDDGYVVKNVEPIRRTKKLRIFSSNPAYSPDEADPDEVTIMGRPVWFARRL